MNDTIGTIYSPDMVESLVGVLHTDEMPIALWTWTAPNAIADGNVSLTTSGLEAFLGYEIEVWNAPLSVDATAERLTGVIRYLLINGPVVGHGETIGTSATDQSTRCFFGTSRAARPTPVKTMFLEFDIDGRLSPRKDLPLPAPIRPDALMTTMSGTPNPAMRTFGRKRS